MGINAFTLARAEGEPELQDQGGLGQLLVRPGQGRRRRQDAVRPGLPTSSASTPTAPRALQVAEERGMFGFGQAADMRAFAPNAQLTAIVDNWGPYYIERTKAVLDGSWKSQNVWCGLKEGMRRASHPMARRCRPRSRPPPTRSRPRSSPGRATPSPARSSTATAPSVSTPARPSRTPTC